MIWLRSWSDCPGGCRADSRLPDLRFALYDTAVTVDNRTGEAVLHAWDLTGEGREATDRAEAGSGGERSAPRCDLPGQSGPWS